MKRAFCLLLAIVILAVPFVSVNAESEMSDYCVYDVSDVLETEAWGDMEERAMGLSLEYKCGVYVILLPGFEEYTHYDDDMNMAASDILSRNDLGYGADRDALLLLIDTSKQTSAYGATGPRGTALFNSTALSEIDPSIVSGTASGDLDAAISSFLDECARLFIYESENGKAYGYTAEENDPEPVRDPDAMITDCVYDYAGLLTADQKDQLEKKARYLSELYEFGVYIYVVNDYNDVYSSDDVWYACEHVYETQGFGYGSANRDGIMLFMSMDERDFATYRTVGKGYYAFTDYGLYELEEYFLPDFRRNDWYGGFQDYLTYCDYLLDLAEKGTPLDYDPSGENDPTYPSGEDTPSKMTFQEKCIVLAPGSAIISLIICLIYRGKMKTAGIKTQANDYIAKNGIRMYDTRDIFTHSTTSRTRVHSESSSSGGHSSGGGHSFSSHSGSHGGGHSGKF